MDKAKAREILYTCVAQLMGIPQEEVNEETVLPVGIDNALVADLFEKGVHSLGRGTCLYRCVGKPLTVGMAFTQLTSHP